MVIPDMLFKLLPGLIFIAVGALYYVVSAAAMVVGALWRAAHRRELEGYDALPVPPPGE